MALGGDCFFIQYFDRRCLRIEDSGHNYRRQFLIPSSWRIGWSIERGIPLRPNWFLYIALCHSLGDAISGGPLCFFHKGANLFLPIPDRRSSRHDIGDVTSLVMLSVILHTGIADPGLLAWIKDFLDHLFGLIGFSPWTVVLAIGLLLLAMPASLIGLYVVQHRRGKADLPRLGPDSPNPRE